MTVIEFEFVIFPENPAKFPVRNMKMSLALPRLLPSLASALLVCALGAVVAYWGVNLMNPSQPLASQPVVATPAISQLSQAAAAFAPVGDAQPTQAFPEVRLLGTVASAGRGRAVLLSDGQPVTLGTGEELSPGITVGEVGPNFVELRAGAASRRFELAEPQKAAQARGKKS